MKKKTKHYRTGSPYVVIYTHCNLLYFCCGWVHLYMGYRTLQHPPCGHSCAGPRVYEDTLPERAHFLCIVPRPAGWAQPPGQNETMTTPLAHHCIHHYKNTLILQIIYVFRRLVEHAQFLDRLRSMHFRSRWNTETYKVSEFDEFVNLTKSKF